VHHEDPRRVGRKVSPSRLGLCPQSVAKVKRQSEKMRPESSKSADFKRLHNQFDKGGSKFLYENIGLYPTVYSY